MAEYGSDFNYERIPICCESILPEKGIKTVYLRSGREAIRYCLEVLSGKIETAYLPAYSCASVALPFEERGLHVVYYAINEKMEPVLSDDMCLERSVFLFINYFGKVATTRSFLERIKSYGAYIIKDSTQDYFDQNLIYDSVDFELCSLRKWMAIPDGAVIHVWNRNLADIPIAIEHDTSWADRRLSAMKAKLEYLQCREEAIKVSFRNEMATLNRILYTENRIVAMSNFSVKYYTTYNIKQMIDSRRANAQVLYDRLSGKVNTVLYQPDACPIYFSVLLENRDSIQKMLAAEGIYCPVIWPIPEAARDVCRYAKYISSHMLALPCDQRYRHDDMCFIADRFENILSNKSGK